MNNYRIFVINPGSTSTKLAMYEGEQCLFKTNVFHDSKLLLSLGTVNEQLPFRLEVIEQFLKDNHIDLTGTDAFVGRGGSCYPVESGVYEMNQKLLEDTRDSRGHLEHPSKLGLQLADELQKKYGGRVFMTDPVVVDEFQDLARVSGLKGVYRKSIMHALNLRAAARQYLKDHDRDIHNIRLVLCHIDGGITVSCYENGKIIDANDASGGEGPFTPTRIGTMPVTDVLDELWGQDPLEVRKLCMESGGFTSYFGTSNADYVHDLYEKGDPQAVRVWHAMIYQISKYIGAMSVVHKGKTDAIVITGGLLRFPEFEEQIREYCGWIAPVVSYPGEFEMEAMRDAALGVLNGTITPKQYTGEPVFTCFPDEKESVK